MEKLVYVLWKQPGVSDQDFKAEVLGETVNRLVELGTPKLSVNLVDDSVAHAKGARITRLDPPPSGTLSFWLDAAEQRDPFENALARVTSRTAGYLVTESVPLRNTSHSTALGDRTPGINMIALIEKPDWISWQDWLEHWLGAHCRVALETQCTHGYVRNVVVRPLAAQAPPWAGIVEEAFPSEAVTDPMLWYRADGSEKKLQKNLARMLESCRAFLDLDRVESHPMAEYRIKE